MKNKMIDLHNALFAELEALQDEDSYKDADGNFDKEKAEHAMKRADAVNVTAGKIMDLQRLQLDYIRTAYKAGYTVNIPKALGLVNLDDDNNKETE